MNAVSSWIDKIAAIPNNHGHLTVGERILCSIHACACHVCENNMYESVRKFQCCYNLGPGFDTLRVSAITRVVHTEYPKLLAKVLG